MTTSLLKDGLESLQRFRRRLYEHLGARRDACLNLLDSLCTNTQARSVVERSLNPAFDSTAMAVAASQMAAVPADPAQPYATALSVQVADSHYSHAAYRHALRACSTHVVIARRARHRRRVRASDPVW
ncbi:hypothetical protein [Allochromatium tepidum]|uniref:Uncharacterized protein n=1 Tax=Allochromatium tepidum TaxID=553982 RepID=A0ABN6GAT8_9GAMM|nr:hypothetical protein [Allochromatium tepidum]BCU07028.1 hypothetical protein Atep_17050 [Allochromatium tepidum]